MGFEDQVDATTAAVTHWKADETGVTVRLWQVDKRGRVVGTSTLKIQGKFLREMGDEYERRLEEYMQPVIPWDA